MDIVNKVISGVENVLVQDSKNSALQPQKRFHLKKIHFFTETAYW
jgi:hypothetical protein